MPLAAATRSGGRGGVCRAEPPRCGGRRAGRGQAQRADRGRAGAAGAATGGATRGRGEGLGFVGRAGAANRCCGPGRARCNRTRAPCGGLTLAPSTRSMARTVSASSSATRVKASPSRAARPVRPNAVDIGVHGVGADRTGSAVLVVAPVFWAARGNLGLIAAAPIWFLVGLLVVSWAGTNLLTAAFPGVVAGWRLWARVSWCSSVGITLVMYAIGWGPTLAIGLVFGAVDCIRLSGEGRRRRRIVLSAVLPRPRRARDRGRLRAVARRANRSCTVWRCSPRSGVVFTIMLFGRATQEKEQARTSSVRASSASRRWCSTRPTSSWCSAPTADSAT